MGPSERKKKSTHEAVGEAVANLCWEYFNTNRNKSICLAFLGY